MALDDSATTAGPSAAFTWDVNGDGTFGDATGVSPTLSAASLATLGLGDGPASATVTLQVTEGATVATDTAALTIINVAPTASVVNVPAGVFAGTSATFTFGATDPAAADTAAGFTYAIDWGDGTPVQTVVGGAGGATVEVTHTYATDGTYTVTVTATDKDAGTSGPATGTVTVELPIPPQAVSQTVAAAEVIAGSLIDDGDFLGEPAATITGLIAVQGPGALSFGVPTEVGDINGRPCGTITVATDGSYEFTPTLPGPRECAIQYTLSNLAGTSMATETFQVPAPQ